MKIAMLAMTALLMTAVFAAVPVSAQADELESFDVQAWTSDCLDPNVSECIVYATDYAIYLVGWTNSTSQGALCIVIEALGGTCRALALN